MKDPHPPGPEREVLPSHVIERLLARAAELDAAQRGAAEIASLREAAAEAGISPSAFDAALGEIRDNGKTWAGPKQDRGRRIRALVAGAAVLIVGAAVVISRVVPARAVPVVEQAFSLHCLSADKAAALVRPMLKRASTELIVAPIRARDVLTVRTATREQMDEAGSLIERQDRSACYAPARRR